MLRPNQLGVLLAGILGLLLCLMLGGGAMLQVGDAETAADEGLPRNHLTIRAGREWQVVLVVNSNCAPSTSPDLRAAVRTIIREAYRQAAAARDGFTTLGVATDDSLQFGIDVLASFGSFDEISVGRQWLNRSVVLLLTADGSLLVGTPALLLVSRSVEVTSLGRYVIGADVVILRLVGLGRIVEYAHWLRGERLTPFNEGQNAVPDHRGSSGPSVPDVTL